jgi:transposase
VVDRWHLLKNLCDDLKRLIERNHQHLKYVRKKEIKRLQKQHSSQWLRTQKEMSCEPTQNYSYRWQQFQQIKRLQKKGVPILKIARTLNMSRNTVKKYLHLSEPPRRKHSFQVNIATFDTYIKKRIKEAPDIQLMKLFKEIKQRGYNGGRTSAFDHLHGYVNRPPRSNIPRLPDVFYLPSKIPFLLLRKWDQLNSKEQSLLKNLCKKCPQIKTAASLATEFRQLMENKKGIHLGEWIKKAITSGISELKSFAKGLLSDIEAVKNALILPWSTGQVEGQINKLKTIKRLMYGRAIFNLLRKRLLLNKG